MESWSLLLLNGVGSQTLLEHLLKGITCNSSTAEEGPFKKVYNRTAHDNTFYYEKRQVVLVTNDMD